MQIKEAVKNVIRKLDQYSLYPLFYPFVMSKNEMALFDKLISQSENYLEFGLGGSTIRVLLKSRAKVYSAESNPEWISHMRKYAVLRYHENKRLFIFPVDIGPSQKWGYPESDSYQKHFHNYSTNILHNIEPEILDMVFIDGRFRVACTLNIISECHRNDDLKIIIHDFWNREHYHILLKYLDVIDKVDTMGIFSIKNNINLSLVAEDYEVYKLNPD